MLNYLELTAHLARQGVLSSNRIGRGPGLRSLPNCPTTFSVSSKKGSPFFQLWFRSYLQHFRLEEQACADTCKAGNEEE